MIIVTIGAIACAVGTNAMFTALLGCVGGYLTPVFINTGSSNITALYIYMTVLGAGGAARAIAVECALAGAEKITVINRTPARGEELAALIRERTTAESIYLPWTPKMAVPRGTDPLRCRRR